MSYPNARDCEHGSLRRQCERCADASEIAALEARLAEVRRERDDLEASMATVAAGFLRARAHAARLEAALREEGYGDARLAALAPGGEL